MDAIGNFSARLGLVLLVVTQAGVEPRAASDLHAQSAAVVLSRQFSDPDLNFIALDDHGNVVAQRWPDADKTMGVGSLVKPFVAVTYGRTHSSFPKFHCAGKTTCWLPRGHGTLGMTDAVAFSCNSYFRQLAAAGGPVLAQTVRDRFGVVLDDQGISGKAVPFSLAHSYLELANSKAERAVAPVIDGMALSARRGTGKAVGSHLRNFSVLAKTGTAPCTHGHKAPGDGFALVMAPADHPRIVLLVRVHGRPGATAADTAGRMLAAIESDGASQ